MDKIIKDRIDAIRQGRIPEGYNRVRYMVYPKDWGEPCVLNSVLTENKERNDALLYDKNDVLSVSGDCGIINQIDLLGRSYAGESVAPYHIVYTGDVVYTKSPLKQNPHGIIKLNKGKPGIVSTLYAVYHCNNNITGQYIENYFCIDSYLNNYLKPIVKRGAKNDMKVNNEDVLTGVIPLPPLSEQQKISEILDHYDKLINLCEAKVDEYKSLKKTCLRKMFPQNGSNVPEIRFPGYTGVWEQRKVADIASETRGGGTPTTSNESYWSGDIPWIQSSDLTEGKVFGVEPRKQISKAGLNGSATQLVPENSIAVVTRVGVGKLAFMPYSYTTSQDFLSFCRLHSDPFFTVYGLYQMLQGELSALQGTSIKGMTKEDLLSKVIYVPTSMDEQTQIGAYFKNLDNLITLHQREVEEYAKLKKAMTQLLLTGIVRLK